MKRKLPRLVDQEPATRLVPGKWYSLGGIKIRHWVMGNKPFATEHIHFGKAKFKSKGSKNVP